MSREEVKEAQRRAEDAVGKGEPMHLRPLILEAMNLFEDRAKHPERHLVLTPWPALDDALGGGLWAREMHVLVGSPGAGKTQLSLAAAAHAAEMGHPVVFVSLEMARDQLVARLLSLKSKIPWSRISAGAYTKSADDQRKLAAAAGVVGEWPFYIDEGAPYEWRADRLEELVKVASRGSERPPLIVLDYLQLVGGNEKGETRQRISEAAYKARDVARKHGGALLLISSTARANYETASPEAHATPPPEDALKFMGAGKESGEIEFSADAVMVLMRAKGGTPGREQSMWLALPKVRRGPPAWVEFTFDGSRFDASERMA
jgi:replicative DNA helicase